MAYLNSNNFCLFEVVNSPAQECYYAPPLIEGDELLIWFNGELDDSLFPSSNPKKVSLAYTGGSVYLDDIGTFTEIVISGTIKQFYFSWTVPALPKGNFKFMVLGDDVPMITSNIFTSDTNTDYTAIVKYKHSVNALGFKYEDAPSIYNQLRIDLRTGNPNYKESVTGYETYEGDLIKTKSDVQKLTEFNTRFFDAGAHEGFFAMLAHDEIYIDDVRYKKSQDSSYDIVWSEDDDNKIGNGTANLLVVSYSEAVNSC